MTEAWSTRIADRYGCCLSSELGDWFDSGIWKLQGHGEFRESIDPAELIEPVPEAIWPGMMGSDCLPILSNTVGDWLCVRIDQNNLASQIIHWYHGGGDWIPWGTQLAEAIAFDAIANRFPSQARRHAVPAESPRLNPDHNPNGVDSITRWAFDRLPSTIASAVESSMSIQAVAEAFLESGVAEVATRCELTVSALLNSEPDDASGVWAQAAEHARPVTERSPELAWAWDTVGFAAERQGDLETARVSFLKAVHCSAFTDQSIRLTTHAIGSQPAKFAVTRLMKLDPQLVETSPYMRMLCDQDERFRRDAVCQYWLSQGKRQQEQQDAMAAYDSFVAAGWDIGAAPIESYGTILDEIAKAAEASGQSARAEVARTHRRCLTARFSV